MAQSASTVHINALAGLPVVAHAWSWQRMVAVEAVCPDRQQLFPEPQSDEDSQLISTSFAGHGLRGRDAQVATVRPPSFTTPWQQMLAGSMHGPSPPHSTE